MVAGTNSVAKSTIPNDEVGTSQGDESEWFEWRTQRVSAKKQAGFDLSSDPRQKSNQEKRSGD
jgi:hypothetical protein